MVLVDCHSCHVLLDGDKKKLAGRVVHSKEAVRIYFDNLMLRDARIKTKVLFYDDYQGILSGTCELLIRRNFSGGNNPEPWMADCQILDLRRTENNQRRAIRIKTNLEVEFQSSHHGIFFGTIRDLSVGGLQLVTRQILHRNERLMFTYSFGGQPQKYEVVCLRGWAEEGGKYAYGCRFVKLTDRAEAAIGGYLFKKQQQMRKEK